MKNCTAKFFSLLLVLCMCVGVLFSPLVYADDFDTEELTEKMNVLRMFGLITDYYDFNTSFDEEVSRADFADVAARLINTSEYKGSAIYYYDVLKSHYAYDSICMLTEMGIISGTGEKLFEPDRAIDDSAAYKILVSLLGYGDMAYYNGGYPMGYINMARKLELFVDSDTPNLTRGEMINLLYNILEIPVLSVVGVSSDGTLKVTESEKGDTLLSIYHDIHSGEGVVNGARMISVNGYRLGEVDEVLIDDTIYVSESDMVEHLGQEVEFFWYDNEVEEKKELLWVNNIRENHNVLYVEVDESASFDSSSLVYTYYDQNDRQRDISLSRGTVLIYNGCIEISGFDTILNKPKYTVKFVKRDGEYNLAIVNECENYVVDRVDTTNNLVYDKNSTKMPLSLDESKYDYFTLENAEGGAVDISSLKAGDVLSVFRSLDGQYAEIILGNAAKVGKIKSLSKNKSGYDVSLEDGTYYMPMSVYDAIPQKVNAGDSVKLYLDYTNDIAYCTIEKIGDTAAYLIGIGEKDDAFAKELVLKLLLEDGSIAILTCKDKVTLDGKPNSTLSEVMSSFIAENGDVKRDLILIRVNADGIIKKIDTPVVEAENGETRANSLSRTTEASGVRYVDNKFFGAKSVMGDNTVMFRVPTAADDVDNEERYTVIQKNNLSNGMNYDIMTYNTTDRVGRDEYVVIKTNTFLSDGKTTNVLPVLVTSLGKTLNSDGEVVESIEAIQGTAKKEFVSDGKFSFSEKGVEAGMLVQLKTNPEGEVGGVVDPFLFNPQATFSPSTTIMGAQTYMEHKGYVIDVVDNVIKIGFDLTIEGGEELPSVDYVAEQGSAPVVVYDSSYKNELAYVGSFADANTYYNFKDACSKVVVLSRYFAPYIFVIYK